MTDNGEHHDQDDVMGEIRKMQEGRPPKPDKDEPQPHLETPEILDEHRREAELGDLLTVPTGWYDIDHAMGKAMRPPWVTVVAARTGVGKTWAVQHLVEQAVRSDPEHRVLFITLEMAAYEMGGRIAAHALGVSPFDVDRKAYAGDDLADEVMAAAPYLDRVLWSDQGVSIQDLPGVYEQARQQFDGVRPTIMVVDYMGLLRWGGNKNASQYERVSENARRLKDFASEHNVLMLASVQLNRQGGRDGSIEPHMDSLRDSGATEEAADLILMFWRTNPDPDGDPGRGIGDACEIQVKVAKNRHGGYGTATLMYDQAMRLVEVDEPGTPY